MNNIKEKYTCDACRYTFESDKLPDRCPDCGKLQVRRASESEIYMNMNIVLTRRKSKKSAVQRPRACEVFSGAPRKISVA